MEDKFNIWEGIYSSFEEAAGHSVGEGFRGEVYNQRALDAAVECLECLKRGTPIPPFHKQRSTILPPVAALMLQNRKQLRILDFGGGLGIGYMTLAESIPGCADRVDYTIIELPRICEQGRVLHSGEILFADELPDAACFDLVHSASALQYVDDWKGLLTRLSSYDPEYILLSDVFAGDISTFATLQTYYSSRIPHWFFNLDEFVSFIASLKYTLEMKTYVNSRRLHSEDTLPMDNFPQSHRISQTLHLLFKRA